MTVEDRLFQVLVSPANLDINGLADSALRSFEVIEKCKTEQPCVLLFSFGVHFSSIQ